jgi:hypothetical protein
MRITAPVTIGATHSDIQQQRTELSYPVTSVGQKK